MLFLRIISDPRMTAVSDPNSLVILTVSDPNSLRKMLLLNTSCFVGDLFLIVSHKLKRYQTGGSDGYNTGNRYVPRGDQCIQIFFFASLLITKAYLYNFDPLKPHFYIVKLGFKGI